MRSCEHRQIGRVIDAWVDRELDDVAAGRVTRHVRDCWDCSSAAESARLIKRSLRGLRDREPPRLALTRLFRFAQRLAEP
jgi:hypothetical protein